MKNTIRTNATVNYNGKTYDWETVSSYFDFEISDTSPEFADLFGYDFFPID